MKYAVIGHGGHGKSTFAAAFAEDHGLTWIDTSRAALNYFIWPKLKKDYKTKDECYNDRINRRQEWFNLIAEYNRDNPARLIERILKDYDIVVGIRGLEEFDAARPLFDRVIGVLWPDKPRDETFELDIFVDSHYIIRNNGKTFKMLTL